MAINGGREVTDIWLWLEYGKVVKTNAEKIGGSFHISSCCSIKRTLHFSSYCC
jgi:hypothetical protein